VGRLEPRPDRNEPGYRIVQCAKRTALDLITQGISQTVIVNQLVLEVMREVPDADFIEVRAIKYEVEGGNDERSISPAPTG
jgi:hypothetical protein